MKLEYLFAHFYVATKLRNYKTTNPN